MNTNQSLNGKLSENYKGKDAPSLILTKNKSKIISKPKSKNFLFLILGLIVVLIGLFMLGKNVSKNSIEKINVDKAEQIIRKDEDLVIVDIRTPVEFRGGKIDKAINIDFKSPNFARDLGEMDKTKHYLFYCNSGNRTEQAIPIIKKLDLNKVYVLESGIQAWVDANKEINKDSLGQKTEF